MAGEATEQNENENEERFVQPAWFTPERMLFILCVINLLNYVDRGVISSNGVNGSLGNSSCAADEPCFKGSGIQGDFSLSYFEDGVLSSAFMIGLLIASPIFAELSKTFNPMRLIGVGLTVWTVATAGCGVSFGFWSIMLFRMLVGVAEASFISLAAPFIDDYAPPDKRTAWLSLFYSCIPVGIALGYVYGGIVGGNWGWRSAFFIESLFMLPFAIFGFVSRPVHLKKQNGELRSAERTDHSTALLKDGSVSQGGQASSSYRIRDPVQSWKFVVKQAKGIGADLIKLLQERVYVIDMLGYIAYNFVVGAYAYWGPKVGEAIFNLENADIVFGGVTILSGILGTLFGGFALDYAGCTIPRAFQFLGLATFLGGGLCMIAFCAKSLWVFIPLFAVGEFSLFATQGPVNFITLHSVHPNSRPIAMAMCTVAIHIFGDVPSSPIVGAVQDVVQNWRTTTLMLTAILFLAAAFWYSGSLLPIDEEQSHLTLEGAKPRAALLSEN